jgi:ribosome assembly protein RRB1
MPKRTSDAADIAPTSSKAQDVGQSNARETVAEDEEMGEFEDRWEDELESDGEVVDAGEDREDEDDIGEPRGSEAPG